MEITHAKDIAFTDSRITAKNSKPVITADAEVTGIETIASPAVGTSTVTAGEPGMESEASRSCRATSSASKPA